jgi:hypothetical protein
MRNTMIVVLCLTVVAVLVALFAAGTVKVREAAARTQCLNSLRSLGLGLQAYHDANRRFPTGTVANPALPPEKRLSWLVEICPAYIESHPGFAIYKDKPWDAPEQCPLKLRAGEHMGVVRKSEVVGVIPILVCPAHELEHDAAFPCLTSYIGSAGFGANAAELPIENPNAGIFGYDRKVTLKDCKHGQETTIMLVESLDGGPWTAGGRATVRGFDPKSLPYFGPTGQLTSNHVSASGSHVAMADASVRFFTSAISPEAIEAMAALKGDKDLARFDE